MQLWIIDNELVTNLQNWDITFVGKKLVVKEKLGDALIDIEFEPPSRIVISRGQFHWDGKVINVWPKEIILPGGCSIQGGKTSGFRFGIVLD